MQVAAKAGSSGDPNPSLVLTLPRLGPRLDQLRNTSDWHPRNPVSMETASAAPRGLARGLLWMGWRHGAGARESAPKTEREREREKGETGKREGWVRLWPPPPLLPPLPVIRSALHRRALAPIHHLSVIHQSEAQSKNVHSCGSERMEGRKWKNPIAPDVDADCGSSRLY